MTNETELRDSEAWNEANRRDRADSDWYSREAELLFVDGAKWQRDQLRTDEAVERVADGLFQHEGSDRKLVDHEDDCTLEHCALPDSYRREARAVITALLGEDE